MRHQKKILLACIALLLGLSFFIHSALYAKSSPQEFIKLDPNEVARFGTVIGQVKKFYVEETGDDKLFAGAIQGMLSNLDPHSSYLDAKSLKMLNEHTSGQFVGLGVEVVQDKGMIKVISPIDDTPAQKAGIKAGDYILAINGNTLTDTNLNDAIKLMRGKKGTKITLTVINEKDKKPREIEITRNVINVKSVKSKMLDDNFGYIRISHFQETTGRKVIAAVRGLQKNSKGHLNGLVLDLRNNPGGILEASTIVADAFLDSQKLDKNKLIVYTKSRIQESTLSEKATTGDLLYGAPLVVLINQGSASASEIVAGALQDHKRAIIIGQKSFGKGSVQTVLPIDHKTAIKLTTALYYTPKGRSIQAEGIVPDIRVDDLKFQKDKEDVLFFANIRELDLKGHLKNGNHKKQLTKAEIKKESKKLSKLATEDYQLYEAVKLLKTMNILQQWNDA